MSLSIVAILALAQASWAQAPVVKQIDDDYRGGSVRAIPNLDCPTCIRGIADSNLIDVIILGDGFLATDEATFDAQVAWWYEGMFGFGARDGFQPYREFVDAFRVWSVFTPSSDYVDSTSGGTYYSLQASCDGDDVGGLVGQDWSNFTTFLDAVETAIANVAFNNVSYPSTLNVTVPGDNDPILHNELADMYRRMVVVMLVQAQCGAGAADQTVSGFTREVPVSDPASGNARMLNISFGDNRFHEFGHALAYLEDEYIGSRGSPASRSNPLTADRSIFLLSNLTYSNDRCGLLWPHLAPGGTYNPDPRSYVGNLFTGGEEELGAWHSEYKCLMNGGHDNYYCDKSGATTYDLRDYGHLCFWCEELTALRILEKTGELDRMLGGTGDLNAKGETWYAGWVGGLRTSYHNRYATADRIRAKDACYRGDPGSAGECRQNDTADPPNPLPACIGRCAIREVGNAVYVGAGAGASPDGSKANPYGEVSAAAAAACSPGRLVVLRDGVVTASDLASPSRIITDRCTGGVLVTPQ